MANSSKSKGDRAERESVSMFLDLCGDLCVPKAKRMLGAGRSEDVGDLHVFPDVAVQVRNYALSSIGTAVRSSAKDAIAQAGHGDMPFGLGLVPYPRARAGTVRWIAAVEPGMWPGDTGPGIHVAEFATVTKALDWVRADEPPYGFLAHPRERRIGLLTGGAGVLIAPIEAWVAAYRIATNRPEPQLDGAFDNDPIFELADA